MSRHRIGDWRIEVEKRPGVPRLLSDAALARAMGAALQAAGAPAPASLELILSDDAELGDLNEEHMGHTGPTDVLSFPLLPPDSFPPHPGGSPGLTGPAHFVLPPRRAVHLGEVVVSVERAIEQAETGRGGHGGDVRWSAADELRLLVIHGTLHVCGWDHAEPEEEAAMRALESRLLGAATGATPG